MKFGFLQKFASVCEARLRLCLKNEFDVSGYKLEDFDRASAQKLMEEGTSNLSKAKDDSERAVAQIQIDTADVVLKSIQ